MCITTPTHYSNRKKGDINENRRSTAKRIARKFVASRKREI